MEPTGLANSTLPGPAPMPENPDIDVEGFARILLLEALGAWRHDPGSFDVALQGRNGPWPTFKLPFLLRVQFEDGGRPCTGVPPWRSV